jgi:hypothetical protein
MVVAVLFGLLGGSGFVFAAPAQVSTETAPATQGKPAAGCQPAQYENVVYVTLVSPAGSSLDAASQSVLVPAAGAQLKVISETPNQQLFAARYVAASDFLTAANADKISALLNGRPAAFELTGAESGALRLVKAKLGGFKVGTDEKGEYVFPVSGYDFSTQANLGPLTELRMEITQPFTLRQIHTLVDRQLIASDDTQPCTNNSHCDCCNGFNISICKCWTESSSMGTTYHGCCPSPQCLGCVWPGEYGQCPCSCC